MSYDGQHGLPELAEGARNRGYDFVAMSEHSDTLDQGRLTELAGECERWSQGDLLLIPGVEYTCEGNLHLLAFGMRHYTNDKSAAGVARRVDESGGVPVVAHPSRYGYRLPENVVPWLAGIEVWNAGYDGRFVPNPHSFRLLATLRRRRPSLAAFCGQDVHRVSQLCAVGVRIECERLDEASILAALREGRFTVHGRLFRFDARREAPAGTMLKLRLARRAYENARWLRDRVAALRP
jgi:hypothetical protein